MRDGFIKVAAATPDILVADCAHNRQEIVEKAREMAGNGAKILVFPELCLTGYTCQGPVLAGSSFTQAEEELKTIQRELQDVDGLIFIGLPLRHKGKLYNAAAVLNQGRILGFVPKHHLPNYGEFYEARYFVPGQAFDGYVDWQGEKFPLDRICCSTVRKYRDSVWQQKSVKTCGHRIRPVFSMPWQEPL